MSLRIHHSHKPGHYQASITYGATLNTSGHTATAELSREQLAALALRIQELLRETPTTHQEGAQ